MLHTGTKKRFKEKHGRTQRNPPNKLSYLFTCTRQSCCIGLTVSVILQVGHVDISTATHTDNLPCTAVNTTVRHRRLVLGVAQTVRRFHGLDLHKGHNASSASGISTVCNCSRITCRCYWSYCNCSWMPFEGAGCLYRKCSW